MKLNDNGFLAMWDLQGHRVLILYIVIFIAAILIIILWARMSAPALPILQVVETPDLNDSRPGNEITVVTWNLGYANLGGCV